jgi:hypothetical protein
MSVRGLMKKGWRSFGRERCGRLRRGRWLFAPGGGSCEVIGARMEDGARKRGNSTIDYVQFKIFVLNSRGASDWIAGCGRRYA